VSGYLGDVVVGDLPNPEAATARQECVPDGPFLALGEESGRVDRLTCGQLQQVTALAADAPTLSPPTIEQEGDHHPRRRSVVAASATRP
jgi:hypothetical protein